jgi:beta-lactam-binding protein with PASTA domain
MAGPIPILTGTFTDRLYDPSGALVLDRTSSNLIVYGALDLIGSLLCNQPGAAPIRWFAVGSGDPGWDTAPLTPVRATTHLVAEVFRTPLMPGDITYDPTAKAVTLHLNLGPDDAVGPLREFGVFGGQAASVRPGSGTLVNYKVHPVIQKAADHTLDRQLVLSLAGDTGLRPGAQDLIGGLLAGTITQGLGFVALGTGGPAATDASATQLQAEGYRKPLAPTALAYNHHTHAITVTAEFDVDEAVFAVAEAGLFGGDNATSSPNTGLLVSYQHPAAIDKSLPIRLTQTFHLALSTGATASVPSLAGMTPAQAAAALDATGLGLGAAVPTSGAAGTLGTVAAQAVAAGTAVPADSLIDVTLVAPKTTQVPPLVGLTTSQATAAITAAGLAEDTTTTVATTLPAGTVVATSPAAWSTVPAGTTVDLTVTTPLMTTVPDVRGRTVGSAQIVLSQAGLTAAAPPYATQQSSGTPGTVVAQAPNPGASAAVGAQVTLTLAAGWTVTAPDLTGITPDAAGASLAAAAATLLTKLGLPSNPPGLAVGSVTRQASTKTLGTVIGQSPAAQSPSPLYGTVSLVVATTPTAAVPDVRGKMQSDATLLLAAAGFTLGSLTTRMSAQPVSTVLDQTPPPGATEPTGSAVSVIVAGPVMVEVPPLVGLALDGAHEGATARDFTLASPTTKASTQTPGTVTAQQPAAYTTAPAGSAITVTLASGVPSLLGLTVPPAQQVLTSLGLAMGTQTTQPSTSPPGSIVGQQPAAGTTAAAGSAVNVVVATVPTVAVPNLVGDDQPTAQQQCTAAGLAFDVVVAPRVVVGTPPGKVVSQSPAASTNVPTGSTVTVTLSPVPPTVVVPNVVGQSLNQATTTLSAVQLTLSQGPTVATTAAPSGTVMAQSPAAATPVAAQSAVTVNLSVQPQGMGVAVPELRGQALSTAQATVQSVGLKLTVISLTLPGRPMGIVIGQDPAPPTVVPPGTTISVTIPRPPIVIPHQILHTPLQ